MRQIKIGDVALPVMYAGVSPYIDRFKAQIYYGDMNLAQIANILEGNQGIEYIDGEQKTMFEGYTKLTSISYVDNETAVATLVKE